jgi:hypothetical protein
LATADNEVDLVVGLLKCAIGVAPFGWWWWSSFLLVVVMVIVVVLATSIITPVITSIVALVVVVIIMTVTPVVITPVVTVVMTVVVAPVIAAVVAVIITSIPVIVERIGPAITVVVVEMLAAVLVTVVVSSGLLGGRKDSKGALQLFALSHGVLGVAVKLALVVHDHVEFVFNEGGRSWRIRHIGLIRPLARPGASVVVVFAVEVVHDRVLSVD